MRIVLLLTLLSLPLLAAQDAMIVNSRSVIYADKALSSPIGYLKSGTKVRVGSIPRNNSRVLPILLTGKVAYIEIRNLSFDLDSKVAKQRMRFYDKETAPKLYISYNFNLHGLGDQWNSLSSAVSDEPNQSMVTHQLDLEIHPPNSKAFGAFGLGYSSLSQENIIISSYVITGTLFYSIFKFRHFTFDLLGGVELSPLTKVVTINSNVTGTSYGYHYGIQARMMYNLKYGLVLGYTIKSATTESLRGIRNPNNTNSYTLTALAGNNIYLGLSYRFK